MGIGFGEIILIVCIALVVVGPKDLPKVAAKVGGIAGEVKRAYGEFSAELEKDLAWENQSKGGKKL